MDLDPHLFMRIRIQEAYLCADPSGSETLSKIQYTFQISLNIDNRIPVPGLAWFYVLIMKMSSWISKL